MAFTKPAIRQVYFNAIMFLVYMVNLDKSSDIPTGIRNGPHLDRSVLTVTTLAQADADDRTYWRCKTPLERLQALELMRQVAYQYDPVTTRLQRILSGPEPLES